MAIVKCHECGREVSTRAKNCPGCGAKVKRPVGIIGKIFVGFFAIVIFTIIIQSRTESDSNAASQSAKSPAQQAADKTRNKKRDAQLQAAGAGALALKHAMKDPTAFDLTSLLVMPNGAACYEYRAKNSFGAVLPSSAVRTSGGKLLLQETDGNRFVAAWNRECTISGGEEIADFMKREEIL